MRLTGDSYYDGAVLMDVKAVSTLGITEDDVKAFEDLELISRAEGAYSADFLTDTEEDQRALHVMSLTDAVNKAEVTEAGFPKNRGVPCR